MDRLQPLVWRARDVHGAVLGATLVLWLVLAIVGTAVSSKDDAWPTFSQVMADDRTVQTLFLCYATMYGVLAAATGVALWTERPPVRQTRCARALTVLVLLLLAIKVALLPCIAAFPVTTEREAHYAVAGTALGAALVESGLMLWRRRLDEGRWSDDLQFNAVWWLALAAFAALFVWAVLASDDAAGWLELVFVLMILLDRAWVVRDYWRDVYDLETWRCATEAELEEQVRLRSALHAEARARRAQRNI